MARAPNIFVVLADDQRADTLPIMTKTLARFGSGTRYLNGLATTPLCGPARCSLLSGMYAHNHGVTQNASAGAVFDHDHSVAKLLKQAGYTTGYVGKYINGWYGRGAPPYFDDFAIFKEDKEYYDTLWNINGVEGRKGDHIIDVTRRQTNRVLQRFDATADVRPWFIVMAPYLPHMPSIPEPQYANDDVDERVSIETLDQEWKRDQLRCLLSLDDAVDEIYDHLATLRERANLLSFYLSDNGYMWGERGGLTRKRWPYGSSTKIPYLVDWPASGSFPAARSRMLVANIDVAPTICEAAGVLQPARMDGRSLISGARRRRLLLEYWNEGDFDATPNWASVRGPNWQYVEWWPDDPAKKRSETLFGIPSDNVGKILERLRSA